MSTQPTRLWPALIETAGLGLSLYLTAVHFGWVAAESVPCPRGSIFACHSILKGSWSGILGVPWALLGMVYFVGHLVMTATGPDRVAIRWLKALGLLAGIAVVMGLRGVEIVHLRKICPLCWGVAALTLAQVIACWNWVPRLPAWPLPVRCLSVVVVALAALGVALTGLLLQTDVRRGQPVTSANEVVPTPASAPVSMETQTTGTLVAPGALVASAPYQQPLGSPIEGPEVSLLRQAGWTVTANPGLVQEAMATRAPVLVFAYDPLCEECHATIRQTLGAADFPTTLGVTLVAVEESALPPELSSSVGRVPTLMLVQPGGTVSWTHEGRVPLADLVRAVSGKPRP